MTDFFQLFLAESAWPARPFAFGQTGETFLLEAAHPISNGSRSITEKPCDFSAAQALRNKKKSMQPVVVARLLRAADFILQGEHHVFTFGNLDSPHSERNIPLCHLMRNYL
jgi:hypothetical protein